MYGGRVGYGGGEGKGESRGVYGGGKEGMGGGTKGARMTV